MILTTEPSKDYELLDSGGGEKLERFGLYTLRRPDPQALWAKALPEKEWKKANASFARLGESAKWKIKDALPSDWVMELGDLKFLIKPTAFKHTGLFPEQVSNWDFIKSKVESRNSGTKPGFAPSDKARLCPLPVKVLNLFGYTGGATLAAARAGAEVTHVDGSKSAITWARKNAELSGLAAAPIRWIEDDARKFVEREIKRGNKYDAVIMDPPAFGHGANNEVWKIEEDFLKLLTRCELLLTAEPLFVLVNGYAAGYSAVAYENCLTSLRQKFGGTTVSGELTIADSHSGRPLPAGIFARWSK